VGLFGCALLIERLPSSTSEAALLAFFDKHLKAGAKK
jgi:hypothetical protein